MPARVQLGATLAVSALLGGFWYRRHRERRRRAALQDFDDAAIRKGPDFDSIAEKRRKEAERRRKLEAQRAKEREVEALFGDTREKPLSPKAHRLKQLTEITNKFEHLWPIMKGGYRAQHWPRAPTAEEVAAYAPEIGVDPVKQPHLLYLAEASLVAPLPQGYAQVRAPSRPPSTAINAMCHERCASLRAPDPLTVPWAVGADGGRGWAGAVLPAGLAR